MYLKIFLNILLIVFLALLQASFVSALPSPFANINILLVVLVYVLIVGSFEISFIYALSFGFLMDMFSFMSFGSHIFGFLFSIVVANFLLVNFFTNRSFYAFLALILSASVLNFFIVYIYSNAISFFTDADYIIFNQSFATFAIKQLGLNMALMLVLYYLTNFLNNRFRPVFLSTKK
ncbi:hypothetical protein C0584_03935 [Candidatus Parcubacteria bacterium]|nr:MAG: hypothetical protein C0584_03935 [Candidatus Parcubacteria bacterium]